MNNNIEFDLLLKDERFIAALAKATQQVNKLNKSVKRVEKTSKSSFSTGRIVKFGVALVGVQTAALAARKGFQLMARTAVSSLKTFAKFEKSMLAVRTLLDDTSFAGKTAGEGFAQMGQDLTKILQTIPIDAQAATKALFDITSAQIGAADATTVLTATGKLAVAGNSNVATSTKAVVSAIIAFGLEASNAEVIAGKFFTAQKLGVTTVEELSAGFGLVSASAAQMGLSLDETLSVIVGSTRGALDTRKAFVGLAAAFKNIVKPGTEAQKVAEKLGIDFDKLAIEQAGGIVPFFKNLKKAIGGNTKQMAGLFGSIRAFRTVASVFTQSGGKGMVDTLTALQDETKTATTLNAAYELSVKALSNQWDLFTNNLDEVKKSIVKGLAPAFGKVLAKATKKLLKLFKELQTDKVQGSLERIGKSLEVMANSVTTLIPSLTSLVKIFSRIAEFGEANALAMDVFTASMPPAEKSLRNFIKIRKDLSKKLLVASISGDTKKAELANRALASVIKEINKLRKAGVTLSKNTLKATKETTKEVSKQNAETKKATEEQAALEKKNAADRERRRQEAAEEHNKQFLAAAKAADKQNKQYLNEFKRKKVGAKNWTANLINQARLVGKTNLQLNQITYNDNVKKIKQLVANQKISVDRGNQALLAAHRIFEEAKREITEKMEAAAAKSRLAAIKSNLQAVATAAASGISSQGALISSGQNVDKAKSAVTAAKGVKSSSTKNLSIKIQDLTRSLETLRQKGIKETAKISTLRAQKTSPSTKRQILLSQENLAAIKEQTVQTKTRLKSSEDALDKLVKSNETRSKGITDAVKDLADANTAQAAAATARDKQAQQAISGIITQVSAAWGIDGIVGPILQLFTDGEASAGFITSLIEGTPLFIEGLVENAPIIAKAIATASANVTRTETQKIFGAIGFAISVVSEDMNRTFNESGISIKEDFKAAGASISGHFDGLGAWVKSIPSQLGEGIKRFITTLGQALVGALTVPFDNIGKFFQGIYTMLKGLLNPTSGLKGSSGGAVGKLYRKATGAATGGLITGAGNRDTVPAMLTPGELVIDRTTGPRLNKFLDTLEAPPQVSSEGGNRDILARILAEVLKPVQVQTEVSVNDEAFANIMLDLSRRNERTG